jgi:hypothetical protein
MMAWLRSWLNSMKGRKAVVCAGDIIVIRGERFRVLDAQTTRRGKLLMVETQD